MTTEQKNYIPSVVSTVDVLHFLKKYKNKKSTANEISEGVNISRSTCYRILKTLTEERLLDYDKITKQYSLGSYLMVLGNRASEFIDYMEMAYKYIKNISELTHSTTTITQRIGDSWVYINQSAPQTPYSIFIRTGQSFPLNAGATGKLIMAHLPKNEQITTLDRIQLKKYTSRTIDEKKSFLEHLKKIKQDGYAISRDEHIEGISGIAFPIFGKNGEPEFTISIVMISNNRDLEQEATKIKPLIQELNSLLNWNN